MKQIYFSLIIACLSLPIFGQVNKFKFTIEYSPNYSKVTDEIADEDYKLSHNIFAKSTYPLSGKLDASFGMGFLNTGAKLVSDFVGAPIGIDKIKFEYNYNYIAFPVGIKYTLGSWFINPEVAFGVNISNTQKSVTWFSDGNKETEKEDEVLYTGEFNKITVPLMLTTGFEVEVNELVLILGLKGYYSLSQIGIDTPRNAHYYGLGVLAGIEF